MDLQNVFIIILSAINMPLNLTIKTIWSPCKHFVLREGQIVQWFVSKLRTNHDVVHMCITQVKIASNPPTCEDIKQDCYKNALVLE